MARYHAEVGEIDQTVVTLAQMAEFCEHLLTRIDQIKDTVSAEWSGEAFAQFQALHAEWAAGAAEMKAGIGTMHQAASTSSSNYTAGVDASRGVWG
ncbi:WXG100 family type VII secretion target [Frondihabitans australicus]|uniref:WXG100 family type VII secretion target n=1 Tax=Frondihabitans australicus TaxID=386892 RepID=A0A495IFU5_9MICO|nr:WXG100 family type VII secretion target [Frondihabitans australicus]RKR73936.1 WXG100 family type VII secretion target [Frondihabitans australicus]